MNPTRTNRPTCLISGSSSGIGAETAKLFAARNYNIVINYNSGRERAEKIEKEIRDKHGVEVLVVRADLSEPRAAIDLVDEAYHHFKRLDVCISNSGVTNHIKDNNGNLLRYSLQDTPAEHLNQEMEQVISLNLLGAYRLCQRSLVHMIEQAKLEKQSKETVRHRSILFITSISDTAPESTRIPYGVSKSGLNHAILGAALEAGQFQITVNGLRPGVIDTPMTDRPSGVYDPDNGREYSVAETYELMAKGGAQPIHRIGTTKDIAEAAFAFCNIPYMTGQLIAVDGGFTLENGFSNRSVFLQEGLRKRVNDQ